MSKAEAPESETDRYEPKTSRSRETVNAPSATTTIGTQAIPKSRVIALPPQARRDAVHGVGDERFRPERAPPLPCPARRGRPRRPRRSIARDFRAGSK